MLVTALSSSKETDFYVKGAGGADLVSLLHSLSRGYPTRVGSSTSEYSRVTREEGYAFTFHRRTGGVLLTMIDCVHNAVSSSCGSLRFAYNVPDLDARWRPGVWSIKPILE